MAATTKLSTIQDFLSQKRIAVAGVSRNPSDFTRHLFADLRKAGYDVVPVNPVATDIDGMRCFGSVREIDPPVSAVLIMTPPDATDSIAMDCIHAGIRRIWMYRATGSGAVSRAAIELCEKSGIQVVEGHCPYMFLPNAPWFHRLHGGILKLIGSYPR